MSTGLIVILGVLVLFIGVIVLNYRRMKNLPDVKPSDRIKTLNNKNFKVITGKGLVLVDFWAAWCGPCKMLSPIINEVAEEAGDSATIAKLNVDHNQEIAGRFKVRSIPTVILFKDGKEINRYVGDKPKKFWLQELTRNK